MTIAEILKAKGVSDDIINAVQEDMKTNKIFTASEENLDVRYNKLKTQHDGATAELTEAKKLIEDLQKSNKGNESLQAKVSEYEAKIQQLQADLDKTQLEAEIKVQLLAAKALDVDYLAFKLKEKGELALGEDGKIKGWDDKLAGLKTQFPNQFEGSGKKNILELKLPPHDGGGATVTKEQFLQMGYNDRLKLKQDNEKLYRQLAKN